MQHLLCAAHFPKDIYIDRPFARCDVIGTLNLLNPASDGIINQLLMPVTARAAMINLANNLSIIIIAVSIYSRDGADTACRCPRARAGMVGGGNTLATFDQWPDFTSTIDNGFQPLKHSRTPFSSCLFCDRKIAAKACSLVHSAGA